MKRLLLLSGLLGGIVAAESVLFHESLTGLEYVQTVTVLGYNATVVNETQWRSMSTADFAAYDAIVLSDPRGTPSGGCGGEQLWGFLNDTKTTWSPAVQGNVILVGGDPAGHTFNPGAVQIMINGVQFAAGASTGSGRGTGLYFVLSCFYSGALPGTPVEYLDQFGNFTVAGAPGCFDDAHIVASSDAMANLTDISLSNWGCSVHEFFDGYPITGAGGFQALAIANNAVGPGAQTFADNSTGVPYIISRGATPAGCGDGVYQPAFGEECDLGADNGLMCSTSCKCVYGVADAAAGTCLDPPVSSSSSSAVQSSTISSETFVSSVTSTVSSSSGDPLSFIADPTFVDLPTLTLSISSDTSSTESLSTESLSSPSSVSLSSAPSSGTDAVADTGTGTGTDSTTPTATTAVALPAASDTIPTSQPIIVGVEIIHITILACGCTSTSQRPIYNTICPGYPDYVGLIGLPAPGDFATVTLNSCAESPSAPMTLVAKTCHACADETYTTSLPGWTPGVCQACLPYYTGEAHTHEHEAQPTGQPAAHAEQETPAPAPASPVAAAGGGRLGAGGVCGALGVAAVFIIVVQLI